MPDNSASANSTAARQRRPQPLTGVVVDAETKKPAIHVSASTAVSTNGNNISQQQPVVVLSKAPPPWHAVLLLSIMVLLCVYSLPTLQKLDEIAVVESFTTRIFPDLVSVRQLALIRGIFAGIIWSTMIQCFRSPGWNIITPYLPVSKLKAVPNKLSGIKTLYPFTSWSWNILGLSFALSSYIAWCVAATTTTTTSEMAKNEVLVVVNPFVLRMAVVCWEIAAPCTLLVAATVRYAIWPSALRGGTPHALNSTRNILMHNCNVVMALTESCILSGLPVRWSEAGLAPLWGCLYVVFTWNVTFHWNDRKHGPQFIYFFFDTTLPGYTCSIALVILLMVLLVFYAAFCATETFLAYLDGGVWTHLVAVAFFSSLVMRFRD